MGGTTDALNFQINWILIGVNENDEIGKLNAILLDPDNNNIQSIENLKNYTNGVGTTKRKLNENILIYFQKIAVFEKINFYMCNYF